MGKSNRIGEAGEKLAIGFLRKKGHKIMFTNWRSKHLEVDIISSIGNSLVFTEVKTRSNLDFGEPHHFVTKAKQNNLIRAANAYCFDKDYHGEIRFDIISIYNNNNNEANNIVHIEDAFYHYG